MNEEDRRYAIILAKLRVVEFALRELIAQSPDRELVKALSARMIELYENRALFEGLTDDAIEVSEKAYRDTFRVIFDDYIPEK
jgi:hypothetical protein